MPRIAVVQPDRCNPQGCGGYLCARVCPVNRDGADCIVPGPAPGKKAKIDEKLCTGCGICPNRCPFEAIAIVNLPEELCAQPIHRYGQNGFHLYNLPTPVFGQVVGLVGRNGIGKSTAIKILAGALKPNLGTDKEATFKDLLKFFKGGEAQTFFERLAKGDIVASYKPQQVDLIPHTAKGTVKQLLTKVDERGAMDQTLDALDIRGILERDIGVLSGGELQRVAIAAAALRKANLYIFDEPTSFLDIKQRIEVSKFIQSLATPDVAVLVVDHDLIILDAMTDLIHIVYGQERVYGITSLPKATRTGINTYLSGFIRDENMRFRDSAITFTGRPKNAVSKNAPDLIGWKPLAKKQGGFGLATGDGKLRKGESLGIVGENGIGKTTFVKILAGALKPDDGSIAGSAKVSYKPQYIDTTSDEIAAIALQNAIGRYEAQIIRPLDIKPLLQKQLNTLSGGELQRVSIAHALSQDADIFLLDEPSAYLDVEQRLVVAKVIRDVAESRGCAILVVDHDLMFLEYLSERLMVFEGKPGKSGAALGPFEMEEGMNRFLRALEITLRRDKESMRPRINKPGSRLDREQRETGKLYYS